MSDTIQHRDDDYLICDKYLGGQLDENGIHRFEDSGKYYFSFIDHGIVVLRSEGYSSEAGRENGVASVLKNMANEDLYSTKMLPDGRWVLSLKAGNHQEIARSCPEESEDEARSYLPSERAKFAAEFFRLASVEAGSVAQDNIAFADEKISAASNEADDYMICREYEEKYTKEIVEEGGFIRFQHENTNKYYFAWVDNDGSIIMRSEGYPTTGARDNGMESVRKNRDLEERYKIVESHGVYFLTLKAGNHQEIGRSCPFKSEAEAMVYLPSQRAKANEEKLRLASLKHDSAKVEDDYMICREYEEQYSKDKVEEGGFIRFHHEHTQKHYFAWVNTNGEIVMRSEGYPTTAARDNGMESVRKNRELPERMKVEEKRGLFYLVLKAGNHQEIGRSCPKESEAALWALILPASESEKHKETESIAAPMVAMASAAVVSSFDKPETKYKAPKKEDDYLPCNAYKGFSVSDKTNNIAFFKHKNGQFYFVVYHKDGSVRLRSEGFKTAQERDQELKGVIKYLDNKSMYSTIEKAGHTILVLKDTNGREVGRSCPEKMGNVPVAAVAAAAVGSAAGVITEIPAAKAAPPITPVIVEKSGFDWRWLLPLLLLIPLFFWWKSCNNKVDESTMLNKPAEIQETAPAEIAPVVEEKPTEAPVAAAPSCDLNWILFDFDRYEIKTAANSELQQMASILKEHPDYKGVLKAYTDARGDVEYNQKLSMNRANAAKDVLIANGINVSRLEINALSEGDPIAKNTEDDSGRRYNRRVELYVLDANGKEICKSIPPDVPTNLKNN